MRPNQRIRRAFRVAPLISVPALAVTMAAVVAVREPRSLGETVAGGLHIMGFFVFGLPLAYALALGIGVPSYLVLRRYGQLSLLPILAITSVVGGIGVAGSLSYVFGSRWDWFNFLLGLPVGMAVGATFWYLGVREPNSVQVA